MITYVDILDAVNTINGFRDKSMNNNIVKQLVNSLEVYKSRGEFDGSIQSAVYCLKQAEYEIDYHKASES